MASRQRLALRPAFAGLGCINAGCHTPCSCCPSVQSRLSCALPAVLCHHHIASRTLRVPFTLRCLAFAMPAPRPTKPSHSRGHQLRQSLHTSSLYTLPLRKPTPQGSRQVTRRLCKGAPALAFGLRATSFSSASASLWRLSFAALAHGTAAKLLLYRPTLRSAIRSCPFVRLSPSFSSSPLRPRALLPGLNGSPGYPFCLRQARHGCLAPLVAIDGAQRPHASGRTSVPPKPTLLLAAGACTCGESYRATTSILSCSIKAFLCVLCPTS
jgi:hypothetical protein